MCVHDWFPSSRSHPTFSFHYRRSHHLTLFDTSSFVITLSWPHKHSLHASISRPVFLTAAGSPISRKGGSERQKM